MMSTHYYSTLNHILFLLEQTSKIEIKIVAPEDAFKNCFENNYAHALESGAYSSFKQYCKAFCINYSYKIPNKQLMFADAMLKTRNTLLTLIDEIVCMVPRHIVTDTELEALVFLDCLILKMVPCIEIIHIFECKFENIAGTYLRYMISNEATRIKKIIYSF